MKDSKLERSSPAARAPAPTSVKPAPVRFRIDAVDPKAHLFDVTCEIATPAPAGQSLLAARVDSRAAT